MSPSSVHKPKITNRKQFEAMVTFMEKHPRLAKGAKYFDDDKTVLKQLLDELTDMLNELGPPIRDRPSDWIKVWTDYKLKTKQKLLKNQRSYNDKEDWKKPHPFNLLEERVINLMNMNFTFKAKNIGKKEQESDENQDSQDTNTPSESVIDYLRNNSLFKEELIDQSNLSINQNVQSEDSMNNENEEDISSENPVGFLSHHQPTVQEEPSQFAEVFIQSINEPTNNESSSINLSANISNKNHHLKKRKYSSHKGGSLIHHHSSSKQNFSYEVDSDNDDRHEIFGKFIASELKRIKDEHICNEVRWNIQLAIREGLKNDANSKK